jgi:hypothetical protein
MEKGDRFSQRFLLKSLLLKNRGKKIVFSLVFHCANSYTFKYTALMEVFIDVFKGTNSLDWRRMCIVV